MCLISWKISIFVRGESGPVLRALFLECALKIPLWSAEKRRRYETFHFVICGFFAFLKYSIVRYAQYLEKYRFSVQRWHSLNRSLEESISNDSMLKAKSVTRMAHRWQFSFGVWISPSDGPCVMIQCGPRNYINISITCNALFCHFPSDGSFFVFDYSWWVLR